MLLALVIISGLATVTDGDTLRVQDQIVRLHGIGAPEGRQYCRQDAMPVLCGQMASQHLRALVAGNLVACDGNKPDRYRRLVAICSINGLDIGAQMVSDGWALAYRRYSTEYVDEETAARKSGAGMWSMQFQTPWEWRKNPHPFSFH